MCLLKISSVEFHCFFGCEACGKTTTSLIIFLPLLRAARLSSLSGSFVLEVCRACLQLSRDMRCEIWRHSACRKHLDIDFTSDQWDIAEREMRLGKKLRQGGNGKLHAAEIQPKQCSPRGWHDLRHRRTTFGKQLFVVWCLGSPLSSPPLTLPRRLLPETLMEMKFFPAARSCWFHPRFHFIFRAHLRQSRARQLILKPFCIRSWRKYVSSPEKSARDKKTFVSRLLPEHSFIFALVDVRRENFPSHLSRFYASKHNISFVHRSTSCFFVD